MAEAENIAVEVKLDISDIDSSVKEMSGKGRLLGLQRGWGGGIMGAKG